MVCWNGLPAGGRVLSLEKKQAFLVPWIMGSLCSWLGSGGPGHSHHRVSTRPQGPPPLPPAWRCFPWHLPLPPRWPHAIASAFQRQCPSLPAETQVPIDLGSGECPAPALDHSSLRLFWLLPAGDHCGGRAQGSWLGLWDRRQIAPGAGPPCPLERVLGQA